MTVETWPGPMKRVEPHVGRIEDGPDRRDDRDVVAEDREVRDRPRPCAPHQRQRGRRRRRLEPDGEEHHVAIGIASAPASARRAASRRCARPCPRAWWSSGLPFVPGTRIMSPKAAKITSGSLRHGQPVVDPAHRQHADRTARAVDQLDVRRQHVLEPEAVDRVRVAAAHLHDAVVARRIGEPADLVARPRDQLRHRGIRRRTSSRPRSHRVARGRSRGPPRRPPRPRPASRSIPSAPARPPR